jgi:hypothetical protein
MISFALNVAHHARNNMKDKITIIWFSLWVIAAIITAAIMSSLRVGDENSSIYLLGLISFIWVEALIFGYLIIMSRGGDTQNRLMPLFVSGSVPLFFYTIAVVTTTSLALGDVISTQAFVVTHLILFAVFIFGSGALGAAGISMKSSEEEMDNSRSFYNDLRRDFSKVCIDIEVVGDIDLKSKYIHVKEEVVAYANPDTAPNVKSLEKELNNSIANMRETITSSNAKSIKILDSELDSFQELIQQRNEQLLNS